MADYSKYFPEAAAPQTDYSAYFPTSGGQPAPKVKGAATLGPEGMKESLRQVAQESGPMGAALAGVGTSVNDAAMRLKQLFGNQLTPQEVADVQAGRQLRQVSTPALFGGIGGNVAMTYPIAPASLAGNVIAGGGLTAATEPVLEGESTLGKMATGMAGGGLGYAAPKVLSRIVQPIRQSAPVRALVDEGIIPTLGQAARSTQTMGGKILGNIEDAITSVPLVGDIVKNARNRTFREVQEAAIARATPAGISPSKLSGREAIEATSEAVSDAYGMALDKIGTVRLDNQFLNSSPQIVQRAVALNPQQKADVANMVEQVISSRVNPAGGAIDARIAKTIDSDLGSYVREFSRSSSASERQMAGVVREIQSQWRELITRNAPDAETAAMLKDANRAFANLLRVEKASIKNTSGAGEFTPSQLNQAVRELTPNKRQFARGNALMQDLSDPAAQVLTGRLGDSGTATRAMIGLGLLGGGAAASDQYGGPNYLTNSLLGMALLSPLYTRAGARYAVGDFPLQQTVAPIIERAAPLGGLLGRSYVNQ